MKALLEHAEKNEFTIILSELPTKRDTLIDRWSFDLAKHGSKTKVEYAWKQKYEDSQLNGGDEHEYGEEIPEPKKSEEIPGPKDREEIPGPEWQEVQIWENDKWWDGTIIKVYQAEKPIETEADKSKVTTPMESTTEDRKQLVTESNEKYDERIEKMDV